MKKIRRQNISTPALPKFAQRSAEISADPKKFFSDKFDVLQQLLCQILGSRFHEKFQKVPKRGKIYHFWYVFLGHSYLIYQP